MARKPADQTVSREDVLFAAARVFRLRGYHGEFAKAIDGWIYVDMHSDGNTTLAKVMAELGLAKEQAVWAAVRYDFGRLVAEGLARATELTREGVRTGLEQVKWLPAADGGRVNVTISV